MINKLRLIALTKKVLSFNSENPPGNELALAKFIENDMRSLGLEVKLVTYAKNRPNIIATLKGSLPRAQAQKQSILLTPHFDTVPIGTGWKYNPLGQVVGNKIYGRGSSDDKGNLAASMEIMRSLVEDGVKLRKDVVMAATVDEETGSKAGILPLVDKKVLKPGLALVLDSDDNHAVIAQKGLIHCRVQIFGKKAHGAYNWLGVNAIEIAALVIAKLKALKLPYVKHQFLREPTINIGTIKGGDKVNMVADFCEFSVDIRYLPGMVGEDVINQIKKVIGSETKKFEFIIDDHQRPYEISKEHPFVKAYVRSAQKEKIPVILKGSEGATVISFFRKHKIPAFATGVGAKGTAHTTDEYLNISTLIKGTKLLEGFVKEYDRI
ncbi:MAG: M20 family metallopeptidase [Candidatus Omnitrophica bacterium]|nr:M20 family metallopeptidase [Candidatus Omnitrophota bacterium]